jgi:hypothetical protein
MKTLLPFYTLLIFQFLSTAIQAQDSDYRVMKGINNYPPALMDPKESFDYRITSKNEKNTIPPTLEDALAVDLFQLVNRYVKKHTSETELEEKHILKAMNYLLKKGSWSLRAGYRLDTDIKFINSLSIEDRQVLAKEVTTYIKKNGVKENGTYKDYLKPGMRSANRDSLLRVEQEEFNQRENAKYVDMNLKREFESMYLGKGKTCSLCNGTGKDTKFTYATKKVEDDTQWDPDLKKMVKVKTTTIKNNDFTSKCKSCDGTGHCSINPGGKYTFVINSNYPGLCFD